MASVIFCVLPTVAIPVRVKRVSFRCCVCVSGVICRARPGRVLAARQFLGGAASRRGSRGEIFF